MNLTRTIEHEFTPDSLGLEYPTDQPEFRFRIKVITHNGSRCLRFPVVAQRLLQALKRATAIGETIEGAKRVDILEVKEVRKE